ncbi:arsenate reductase (glutaredoxin) [Sphingomonas oligophenolica]|uniref:Arsenate reductase n=1 Tax=Sphingomonas oligophenolica TaxID=301154 RepID=A0A502CH98_9SPHN|nr:arsenate reductase (glutaredoxin) [Sphingomonas oligophenolica]TPG12183.1 arsenate reductase (glutaredoxin) [Sphingomonas oligophenolica]
MRATIYHNPRCSTSRQTLALLEAAGVEVTIVDYLKTPLDRDDLKRLYTRAGITPRDGLRVREDAAKPLVDADDDAVLDAMVRDPILIQRPLVETTKGVRLARPPESVHDIL